MKNLLIFILAMSYNMKSAFSSDEEGDAPSFFDEMIDNHMSLAPNMRFGSGDDDSGSGDVSGSGSGSFINPTNKTNEKNNNSTKTRNYVSVIVVVIVIGLVLFGGVIYKLYDINTRPVHNVSNVNNRPISFNGTNNNSYSNTMINQSLETQGLHTFTGNTSVPQCTEV